MRLLSSFFLSLVIYSGILGFFLFVILNQKVQKKEIVYIHQAILIKKTKKQTAKKESKTIEKPKKETPLPKKQAKPTPKKELKKEIATKDNFSKGGEDIKFDDIFSNVNENIATTKIKQKKQKQMTKKVNDNIKAVEALKKQLTAVIKTSNTTGNKNDIAYIQNELAKVWNSIDTNDGDFVRIQINVSNNNLDFSIISTNLDTIRLNQFINRLKNIDITKIKNLNTIIDFKSKLKE